MEGKKRFINQTSTLLQSNDKEWQDRKFTQKLMILSQQNWNSLD